MGPGEVEGSTAEAGSSERSDQLPWSVQCDQLGSPERNISRNLSTSPGACATSEVVPLGIGAAHLACWYMTPELMAVRQSMAVQPM
ncbi:hypothetical protein [Streptomyces sp. SLBN-8D4]|uniref:hypothetical protein n=1 Tax=Streptomyces sp. SLBN-8D4 TaxID=3377728 RepID=UPI003C7E80B7